MFVTFKELCELPKANILQHKRLLELLQGVRPIFGLCVRRAQGLFDHKICSVLVRGRGGKRSGFALQYDGWQAFDFDDPNAYVCRNANMHIHQVGVGQSTKFPEHLLALCFEGTKEPPTTFMIEWPLAEPWRALPWISYEINCECGLWKASFPPWSQKQAE